MYSQSSASINMHISALSVVVVWNSVLAIYKLSIAILFLRALYIYIKHDVC